MDKNPDQILRELLKAQGVEADGSAKAKAVFSEYSQAVYDQGTAGRSLIIAGHGTTVQR